MFGIEVTFLLWNVSLNDHLWWAARKKSQKCKFENFLMPIEHFIVKVLISTLSHSLSLSHTHLHTHTHTETTALMSLSLSSYFASTFCRFLSLAPHISYLHVALFSIFLVIFIIYYLHLSLNFLSHLFVLKQTCPATWKHCENNKTIPMV